MVYFHPKKYCMCIMVQLHTKDYSYVHFAVHAKYILYIGTILYQNLIIGCVSLRTVDICIIASPN